MLIEKKSGVLANIYHGAPVILTQLGIVEWLILARSEIDMKGITTTVLLLVLSSLILGCPEVQPKR